MMSENNNGMYMPVAPAYANNNGWGGFGGDGWWVILFLFALMGNGFGGWGGNGMMGYDFPWLLNGQNGINQNTNNGFQNALLSNQLTSIQDAVNSGFAGVEVSACNRAMNQMQTDYTNQIASMNQRFADTQNISGQLNTLAMGLQNCCCENRAATADLKYTVATEACADGSAVSEALRDVLTANTASTQRILDQMCQDKIDAKNEKIAELQNQLNMAQFAASNNQQTQTLLTDNLAQTNALEQYLSPVPRPAYIVQNPNCCANYNCGCGCGV